MPFCPKCGYEYQAEITHCSDCGAALVAELPSAPRFSTEPLVVVYEAPDEDLSRLVKGALEGAGITIVEQVERTAGYDSIDLSVVGRYSRLLTLESRADEARRLIAEFLDAYNRGDLALLEEAKEGDSAGEVEENGKS